MAADAPTGILFVRALIGFGGSVAMTMALALWLVETGTNDELKGARKRFGRAWRALLETPAAELPRCLTWWLAARLDRGLGAVFGNADRGIAFGSFVFAVIYVILPLAALANALRGGSPFLMFYYVVLLGVVVVLLFSGEVRRLAPFNGLAAAFLGASLFVIIPVYATHALTLVTINSFFTYSVLNSFLVAGFWYITAYGVGVVTEAGFRFVGAVPATSAMARTVSRFLAVLPAAYVLTFLGLLAGHLAVSGEVPHRSWQVLLTAVGAAAAAVPATLNLLKHASTGGGARLARGYGIAFLLAAVLALVAAWGMHAGTERALGWPGALHVLAGLAPGGGGLHLGADFWVSHLAFLPLSVFAAVTATGLLAKGCGRVFEAARGAGAAAREPFLAWALTFAVVAGMMWLVSGGP